MMIHQLWMSFFLIGFSVFPGNAHPFPLSPERVSSACLAQIDAILVREFQDGINYDPASQSWWFEGIPTEIVRYDIRGNGIDLVRVRFLADGEPRSVWVAAGIQLWTGEFHTWGPWQDERQAFEELIPGRTHIRVDIGETQGALVDRGSRVDFSACNSPMCHIANWSEISSNNFSQRFIASNGAMAPGWYPWGYLVWRITPQDKLDSCSPLRVPLNAKEHFRLYNGILMR